MKTTFDDLKRLLLKTGLYGAFVPDDVPDDVRATVYVESLRLLVDAAKAEEREACAMVCESHRDQEEYTRASRRVDEALANGTRDDQLRALRHESDVRLYHAGLNNAAQSIRARTQEAT